MAASSSSMTYGSTPAAVTPTYSGFVNGENSSVLNALPTCTTAATPNSPVGTYASTCSGASDPNYAVTYVPGTVVVGASALVISASSGTQTYGTTPSTPTPTYSGFVNGDGPGSLTAVPTCTTTATASSPVGAYATSCSGAVDPNYSISYTQGSDHVVAAPLTVSASSATMVYGGAEADDHPDDHRLRQRRYCVEAGRGAELHDRCRTHQSGRLLQLHLLGGLERQLHGDLHGGNGHGGTGHPDGDRRQPEHDLRWFGTRTHVDHHRLRERTDSRHLRRDRELRRARRPPRRPARRARTRSPVDRAHSAPATMRSCSSPERSPSPVRRRWPV